jgi:hypothetical protein
MTQEQQHSITPTPELVDRWRSDWEAIPGKICQFEYLATRSAQWGADQEREAIIHWLITGPYAFSVLGRSHNNLVHDLRLARRPKPPSLKEQALAALEVIPKLVGFENERDAIRAALEALDD